MTVPSPDGNGSIKGYLVRPANADKLPAVLVVHENRGLNPYIEDVARRLAVANFIAFAPDGLTSVGGYPGDDEKGAGAVPPGRPGQDAGGFRSPRRVAEIPARRDRQARRNRLLLRRRRRQPACRAHGRRSRRRRSVLRRSAGRRRRGQDQGADQRPIRRTRSRASPAAGRPSTPPSPRRACRTRATSTRAPTTASTTTRRRATIRPRRRKPGGGRSIGSTNICGPEDPTEPGPRGSREPDIPRWRGRRHRPAARAPAQAQRAIPSGERRARRKGWSFCGT